MINYNCSISPDGRWIASSSWPTTEVKVWDTRTGKLVKTLSVSSTAVCAFSPNGKWLAVGTREECRLWEVGSWRPGLIVFRASERTEGSGELAFRSDGKVLALALWDGRVLLVDPATGKKLATLEPPNPQQIAWLCFSPDGSRLAVACKTRAVQLWDLRAIRQQLGEIGLDWDAPLSDGRSDRAGPLKVEVVTRNQQRLQHRLALYTLLAALSPYHPEPYHLRGHVHEKLDQARAAVADFSAALIWETQPARRAHFFDMRATNYLRLGQHDEAIADLEASLTLKPNNPRLRQYLAKECNNRAWRLATGPQGQRNPARVLKLARRAVELAPGTHIFLNTLGLAEYRNGQYREAKKTLEKSLALGKGAFEGFDLFFLAMCHAKLGDKQKARDCFDRAVQWVERQKDLSPQHVAELKAFRAEASQAIGERGHYWPR